LLVRAREIADGLSRIEVEPELGKQAFGTPTHLFDTQESELRNFAAKRKILRDGEVRD
jgi:hypothetical protein